MESEINFADNPTLKDFLNLSNGGGRFLKATQDARRQAAALNSNAMGGGKSSIGQT